MSGIKKKNFFRSTVAAVLGICAVPSISVASGADGTDLLLSLVGKGAHDSVVLRDYGFATHKDMAEAVEVAVVSYSADENVTFSVYASENMGAVVQDGFSGVAWTAAFVGDQEKRDALGAMLLPVSSQLPTMDLMGEEEGVFVNYNFDTPTAYFAQNVDDATGLTGANIHWLNAGVIAQWAKNGVDYGGISERVEAKTSYEYQPFMMGEEEGVFVQYEAAPSTADYVEIAMSAVEGDDFNVQAYQAGMTLMGEEEGVFVGYQKGPVTAFDAVAIAMN
jgi:hypothetical protein